jgi:hypothetical protein
MPAQGLSYSRTSPAQPFRCDRATFDLSRLRALWPHWPGSARGQTVTASVFVGKPGSELRPDWRPCGPWARNIGGWFPVPGLPLPVL